MNHVVAVITPFALYQKISVYIDGECKKTIDCKMEDVEKSCYTLCKEFNIHQLDVHGWQGFGDKLQRELNKSTEFNDFQITVSNV